MSADATSQRERQALRSGEIPRLLDPATARAVGWPFWPSLGSSARLPRVLLRHLEHGTALRQNPPEGGTTSLSWWPRSRLPRPPVSSLFLPHWPASPRPPTQARGPAFRRNLPGAALPPKAVLAQRLPAACFALLLLCLLPARAEPPSTTYKKCLSGLTTAKGEERAALLSRLAFLAHYHLKDYEVAESHYQQAIRETREPCRVRLDLASLYVNRLSDNEKAIAELTAIVAKGCQPEAVQEAWSLLGAVYSSMDEYRKAIDAYGKAVSSGPSGIVDLVQPEDEEEQKIKKTLTWTAPTGGAARYVIRYSRKEPKAWKNSSKR